MTRPGAFKQAVRGSLTDALVEPPGHLGGFRPQQNIVGEQHGLPSQIGFGSSPPGFGQNSRFTGATTASPLNLTAGESVPTFAAPSYASAPGGAGAASPLLAALTSRLSLPQAATGATAGGSGRVTPPVPEPGAPHVTPLNQGVGGGGLGGGGPRGGSGGGYTLQPGLPAPHESPLNLVPYQPQSSALIAALAQLGQRLGSGRSQYGLG